MVIVCFTSIVTSACLIQLFCLADQIELVTLRLIESTGLPYLRVLMCRLRML